MAAILTQQAVLLLARDRLGQIRDLLQAKVDSGLAVEAIDQQVLYLARKAFDILSAAPHPQVTAPARDFDTRLGDGVSTYAVMGSLGPELPALSAMFAPGQAWAVRTMRGGTADPNRQGVQVRSVDFLLDFWERAERAIAAADASKKDALRNKLRAFALGHLAGVAGDLIVSPVLDDLEAHYGSDLFPARIPRAAAEAALDDAVANRVFRSSGTRRGTAWTGWWPPTDDVPTELYTAFSDAFNAVHQPLGHRPPGFADFEAAFPSNLPEMSDRFVRDGYNAFRAILQRGYEWTWGDALVALIPAFAPPVLAMPFTALLSQGKFLLSSEDHDEGKAWAEALALSISATSFVPLVYTIYAAGWTYLGVGTDTVVALVAAILVQAACVVFFSTLPANPPAWVQGLLLFLLPLAIDIGAFAFLVARGHGEKNHRLLGVAFLMHALLAGVVPLGYALFRPWVRKGPGDILFWVACFLWLAMLGVPWMIMALVISGSASAELGGDVRASGRHFPRLFDDGVLFHERAVTLPSLADRLYPADGRKIIKLWSTAGDLHVRPRGHFIEFFAGADPTTGPPTSTVLAPIAPMTLRELVAVMKRTVAGLDGQALVPDAEEYDLPAGALFADHGDLDASAATETARAASAARFVKLGTSGTADDAYVLRHALRHRLATRMGAAGPSLPDFRTGTDSGGAGRVDLAVGLGPSDVTGTAGTTFLSFFRVGDILESPPGGAQSAVVAVASDTALTTQSPLGLGGPTAFNRIRVNRDTDVQGPGNATVAAPPTTVTGDAATRFFRFFLPGDTIQIGIEVRKVVTVTAEGTLTVDQAFTPGGPSPYYRLAREAADGYPVVPEIALSHSTGDTLLEQAADLAAMLCMGGVSRMLTEDEARPAPAGPAPAPVNPVVQVFRNWNLDHRRVNEWRMLIAGGAVSEKRGDAAAVDPLLPALPAGWTLRSGRGEPVSNRLGWVPLLRRWLDVARRPGVSSRGRAPLFAGDPTNLNLSRAMAYLLDMPDPEPDPTVP